MGEPDQYVHQTEGPAAVGLAVEKACGRQLMTSPFAYRTPSAILDSGLGTPSR